LLSKVDKQSFYFHFKHDDYSFENMRRDVFEIAVQQGSENIINYLINTGHIATIEELTHASEGNSIKIVELLMSSITEQVQKATTNIAINTALSDDTIFTAYLNSNTPDFTGATQASKTLSEFKQQGHLTAIEIPAILDVALDINEYDKALACLKADYPFTFIELADTFENISFAHIGQLQSQICQRLLKYEGLIDAHIKTFMEGDRRMGQAKKDFWTSYKLANKLGQEIAVQAPRYTQNTEAILLNSL
ncbi:MAG: hypothetical protein HAW67_03115, partial [Endozoicomonadaceae bacterium]|nr:hypothetical protein [Endozoicomonadaceae bacterium]